MLIPCFPVDSQLAQLGQQHAQEERHVFVEPMKDMARNLTELKKALKRRQEAYRMLLVRLLMVFVLRPESRIHVYTLLMALALSLFTTTRKGCA